LPEEGQHRIKFPLQLRNRIELSLQAGDLSGIVPAVTHHAEKGPLSRTQVEFVRRVHALVKEHIEKQKPVDSNRRYLPD
jgi:hypothetical protein